jgi:hypothetical protein
MAHCCAYRPKCQKYLRAERVENATIQPSSNFRKKMLQKGASVERFTAEWRHSWIKAHPVHQSRSQKFLPCNELSRVLERTANWWLMRELIAVAWSGSLTRELMAATFGKES